jgi:hypothetical protein
MADNLRYFILENPGIMKIQPGRKSLLPSSRLVWSSALSLVEQVEFNKSRSPLYQPCEASVSEDGIL